MEERKQRELVDVIAEMLAIVPASELNLHNDLGKIRTSASYAAPEMQRHWWARTADILQARFGEESFTDEWQDKLFNIWMDKAA